MKRKLVTRGALAALPLALLLTACNDAGDSGEAESSGSALADAASQVPIVSDFLASCTEAGTAILEDFTPRTTDYLNLLTMGTPFQGQLASLPTLEEVLENGDAASLPVIGGVESSGQSGSPLDLEEVLAQLDEDVLPGDVPVLGLANVTCEDGLVPVSLVGTPPVSEAIGAIPVFGPELGDGSRPLLGVVAAVVGNNGTTTENPSGIEIPVRTLGLPDSTSALPSSLSTFFASVLSALGL